MKKYSRIFLTNGLILFVCVCVCDVKSDQEIRGYCVCMGVAGVAECIWRSEVIVWCVCVISRVHVEVKGYRVCVCVYVRMSQSVYGSQRLLCVLYVCVCVMSRVHMEVRGYWVGRWVMSQNVYGGQRLLGIRW